jgi:hypothetical protein
MLCEGTIMRRLSSLLPASLLLLASSTGAQTLPYPQAAPESMSTVQVTAPPKTVRIWPEQAQAIRGSYAMSNGWNMKVDTTSRYINATIDDQQPLRLFAVGTNKFASRDGNVNMEFNPDGTGDDVVMSYVPDPRLAQVVVISARVAQR